MAHNIIEGSEHHHAPEQDQPHFLQAYLPSFRQWASCRQLPEIIHQVPTIQNRNGQ